MASSTVSRKPALEVIAERIPNTLILMGTAFVVTILISVVLGIYAATHKYSWGDYLVTTISFFGYSMPSFWFGLMLIIIFAVKFKEWGLPYLPAGSKQRGVSKV